MSSFLIIGQTNSNVVQISFCGDNFSFLNYNNVTICFIHNGEVEADYIGLMLMASAGYDPLVAPKVFKKIGRKEGGEF